MSIEYYISNRIKREEIQAFNKFWEENLIPSLKEQINNYCKETAGTYVNEDFAKEIIDSKVSKIAPTPGDSSSYKTGICSTRCNGSRTLCQWEGVSIDDNVVRDETSLIEFFALKENQGRYCITDQGDKEYTLSEFLHVIKSGGKCNEI